MSGKKRVLSETEKRELIEYYKSHSTNNTLNTFFHNHKAYNKKVLLEILSEFNVTRHTKEEELKFRYNSWKESMNKYSEEELKLIRDKQTRSKQNMSESEKYEYHMKLSSARYKTLNNQSKEDKQRISIKIANTLKVYYQNISEKDLKKSLNKRINTKRRNKTFNTSKIEMKVYQFLDELFKNDVISQYRDDRYPYCCDFYIKSLDLFIELNAHWTHGGHSFNANNQEDIDKLNKWQEKAKTSKFYDYAIYTWTSSDIKKMKCAKFNNLNYITIYENDFNKATQVIIDYLNKNNYNIKC